MIHLSLISPTQHEMASLDMFDYLIRDNALEEEFQRYGLDDRDIVFIKEQIEGPRVSENISQAQVQRRDLAMTAYTVSVMSCGNTLVLLTLQGAWPYVGRPEEMSFLYEVTAYMKHRY